MELESPHPTRTSPWVTWIGCVLMLFLILFPKGGIRLVWLPLTWGYLLLP